MIEGILSFRSKLTTLDILGVLFWILLIWFAKLWCLERMMLPDPAFYLWTIINTQDFCIIDNRYTALITQIPPLLATWMESSLQTIIESYSIGFVGFATLVYMACMYGFRNRTAGVAILLIFSTGIAYSYFRPTSESINAMLNSILFFSFLESKAFLSLRRSGFQKVLFYSLVVLFVSIGYFSHPIALFSLLFVIGFIYVDQYQFRIPRPYILVGIVLAVFGQRIFFANKSDYESGIYGNLTENPLEAIQAIPTYYSVEFFRSYFELLFLPLLFMLIVNIALLISRKKWLMLLYYLGFFVGYFIVAAVTFQEGDSNMQMEKIYLPLTLCSAMVFGRFFVLDRNWAPLSQIILVLLIIFGITRFQSVHKVFKNRVDYLNVMVDYAVDQNYAKLVIAEEQVNLDLMRFWWASGIETYMISVMRDKTKPRTVHITPTKEQIGEKDLSKENFIPTPFWPSWSYDHINRTYFNPPKEEYHLWDKVFK